METKCPICAAESVVVAKLTVGELLKCSNCYWLFTQGVPLKLFEKVNLSEEKKNEYLSIVRKSSEYVQLGPTDKVLDINSGDGTLLGWYLKNIVTVGVEPDVKLMRIALNEKRVDVPMMVDFLSEFPKAISPVHDGGKFKVITVVDVFQDYAVLPLLVKCKTMLVDEGVIVVQTPYFPQLFTGLSQDFVLSQNYILAYTLKNLCQEAGLELRGVGFPKKGIRGYITYPGFRRFAIVDFDAKLKMYTQLSAAIITELHARFDLDRTYQQLEQKLYQMPLGARNVDQTTPK